MNLSTPPAITLATPFPTQPPVWIDNVLNNGTRLFFHGAALDDRDDVKARAARYLYEYITDSPRIRSRKWLVVKIFDHVRFETFDYGSFTIKLWYEQQPYQTRYWNTNKALHETEAYAEIVADMAMRELSAAALAVDVLGTGAGYYYRQCGRVRYELASMAHAVVKFPTLCAAPFSENGVQTLKLWCYHNYDRSPHARDILHVAHNSQCDHVLKTMDESGYLRGVGDVVRGLSPVHNDARNFMKRLFTHFLPVQGDDAVGEAAFKKEI